MDVEWRLNSNTSTNFDNTIIIVFHILYYGIYLLYFAIFASPLYTSDVLSHRTFGCKYFLINIKLYTF